MNFLTLLATTLKKQHFFHFNECVCRFSAAHGWQSTAIDSYCSLFIGYQKPAKRKI